MELGNFATSHRANFRHIFDLGGPSWWIVDGGVSENILSSTYLSIKDTTQTNGTNLFREN